MRSKPAGGSLPKRTNADRRFKCGKCGGRLDVPNNLTSEKRAEEASRAVREYLAALDAADHDEEIGGDDDSSSRGGKRRKPPKQVSLTDPQAAWVARKNTDPFFAYDANYLIDNKAGIIVDAEGTRGNRIAEIAVTETMIERVKDRFDLQPRRLAGDTEDAQFYFVDNKCRSIKPIPLRQTITTATAAMKVKRI
jgi:hypothetical protein